MNPFSGNIMSTDSSFFHCDSERIMGFLLLILFCLGVAVLPAKAQTSDFDPDVEARKIFTTVMSPYCPGLMLSDCTSSAAAELRTRIKAQLRQGTPPEEIMAELVDVFGNNILGLPPREGMGLLAWIGPIAALATSLLIIFWWVKQRREPIPAAEPVGVAMVGPEPGAGTAELKKRLEEELRQFD